MAGNKVPKRILASFGDPDSVSQSHSLRVLTWWLCDRCRLEVVVSNHGRVTEKWEKLVRRRFADGGVSMVWEERRSYLDGPAVIKYDCSGNLESCTFFASGELLTPRELLEQLTDEEEKKGILRWL